MTVFGTISSFITGTLESSTILVLLSVSALIIFYLWFNSGTNEHELFAERNIKHVPFGNILFESLRKTRFELYRHEILTREGNVLGAIQIGRPTIFMNDPELAQQVFSKHFTSFTNRRNFQIADPVLSHSLFATEDDKWKRCRSIMTPTFATGKLRLMKPILDTTVKSYVDNFGKALENSVDGIVEAKSVCGAFTMDTIVQIAFGVKIDSLNDPNNKLLKHARSIFQRDFSLYNLMIVTLMVIAPSILRLFDLRMNKNAVEYFGHLAENIIRKKREAIKNSNNNCAEHQRATNFIELLLEAENERLKLEANEQNEGSLQKLDKLVKYMSDEEILAQSVMFLMVGYDTTATTITLTLYHLALNSTVQERLFDEIISTMKQLQADRGGECADIDPIELFSFDAIQKMKLLEAVVKETLRLFPPAFLTERRASEDVQLENGPNPVFIKKGDVINFPIFSMHRDPRYWNNPEEYNPDRFLDPNPTHHKYSYIPFGAGPRDCIAKNMAYLEAKIAILHAVRLFKFSRAEKTQVPVEFYYQTHLLVNRDVHLKMKRR